MKWHLRHDKIWTSISGPDNCTCIIQIIAYNDSEEFEVFTSNINDDRKFTEPCRYNSHPIATLEEAMEFVNSHLEEIQDQLTAWSKTGKASQHSLCEGVILVNN